MKKRFHKIFKLVILGGLLITGWNGITDVKEKKPLQTTNASIMPRDLPWAP